MLDFRSLLSQLCTSLVSELVGTVFWAGLPPLVGEVFSLGYGSHRGIWTVAAPWLAAQRKWINST